MVSVRGPVYQCFLKANPKLPGLKLRKTRSRILPFMIELWIQKVSFSCDYSCIFTVLIGVYSCSSSGTCFCHSAESPVFRYIFSTRPGTTSHVRAECTTDARSAESILYVPLITALSATCAVTIPGALIDFPRRARIFGSAS